MIEPQGQGAAGPVEAFESYDEYEYYGAEYSDGMWPQPAQQIISRTDAFSFNIWLE